MILGCPAVVSYLLPTHKTTIPPPQPGDNEENLYGSKSSRRDFIHMFYRSILCLSASLGCLGSEHCQFCNFWPFLQMNLVTNSLILCVQEANPRRS
uniref:Uncharacterized protein n=1 Tax=Helianthus annuus TaxID=4232 RepID=A0A251S863_HELAN